MVQPRCAIGAAGAAGTGSGTLRRRADTFEGRGENDCDDGADFSPGGGKTVTGGAVAGREYFGGVDECCGVGPLGFRVSENEIKVADYDLCSPNWKKN